jgi:hypothetical protein
VVDIEGLGRDIDGKLLYIYTLKWFQNRSNQRYFCGATNSRY